MCCPSPTLCSAASGSPCRSTCPCSCDNPPSPLTPAFSGQAAGHCSSWHCECGKACAGDPVCNTLQKSMSSSFDLLHCHRNEACVDSRLQSCLQALQHGCCTDSRIHCSRYVTSTWPFDDEACIQNTLLDCYIVEQAACAHSITSDTMGTCSESDANCRAFALA